MLKKQHLKKIQIFLMLIPFFELQSWSQLSDNQIMPQLFNAVLSIYSGLRLLITAFVIFELIRKKRIKISSTVIGIIAFVLLENISGLLNGSLYLNFTIGSLSLLGFALLCQNYISSNRTDFIWACKKLFGILSLLGAIQIILMPYGFLNVRYKAYAIYFLGAKNSGFFYYATYLFFSFYDDIEKKQKIGKKSFLILFLFMIAALSCESMNTMMMLLIILIFAIVNNYGRALRRLLKPRYILIVVTTIAVVILVSDVRQLLSPILNLIGRDATFTGRDVLWDQAIQYFRNNPFSGNGILTEYTLIDGVVQDNAHSQFLDLLAKYGIFVFVTYISIPVLALRKAAKADKGNRKVIALKSAIVFIVLFHSIIDHMTMYHFILLMSSIELISNTEKVMETRIWSMNY